jgi:hypothetical protein
MKHNSPKPWDVRIIQRPVRSFFGLYTRIERIPCLLVKHGDSLCHALMTSEGFAIGMDNRQLPGEMSSKGWKIETTFRINGFAMEERLTGLLGNKRVQGHEITGAQAIAYIFGLPGWKTATPDTLYHHRKTEE